MLSAVLSPATYSSHFLSGSLYLLVTTLAAGYAIVLLVIGGLDRYPVAGYSVDGDSDAPNSGAVSTNRHHAGMLALLARNRWFWIPPLYVLALLLVVIVTHSRGTDAAQLMYRNF